MIIISNLHQQGKGEGLPASRDRRYDQDGRQTRLEVRLHLRSGFIQRTQAVRSDPKVTTQLVHCNYNQPAQPGVGLINYKWEKKYDEMEVSF